MKLIINGESVDIGGSSDANITVLTEEEFNALPESEQNNGVYFISGEGDSGGSGGSSESLIVYSTEEKRIGTWIDGRPLYRKGFILNKAVGSGFSNIIDATELNMDAIVNACGYYSSNKSNGGMYKRKFPDTTFVIGLDESKTHVVVYCTNNYSNIIHDCVLEYTKTTDQPEVTS